MNAEIQLGGMMSFMNDFTPAPPEALSLHSVTASTVFSFPLESNVDCVISAAHFLTRGHVALSATELWMTDRAGHSFMCVWHKGLFSAQPMLFGSLVNCACRRKWGLNAALL